MATVATWALLLPIAAVAASTRTGEAPIAAHQEPFHKLVFQNELVRVLDVRVPAGRITQYHVRANPMVTIAVEDARTWAQRLGEDAGPESAGRAVPFADDNWGQDRPYTHRVANIGDIPFRRIGAEWLAPAGSACTALAPPPGFRLIREGQFGRVYEIRLDAGQATPTHAHSCPGMTVQGTPSRLRSRGSKVAAQSGPGAGHWSWRNAGHSHVLRNGGDQAMTVYEIDWR